MNHRSLVCLFAVACLASPAMAADEFEGLGAVVFLPLLIPVAIPIVILSAPATVPMFCTDDFGNSMARYSAYPYPSPDIGYLVVTNTDQQPRGPVPPASAPPPATGHPLGCHLDARDLVGRTGSALTFSGTCEFPHRLGIVAGDTEFTGDDQRHGRLPQRALDLSLTYRFSQSTKAEFTVGAGLVAVIASHPASGPRAFYDVDLFPVQPLVVTAHAGAGVTGGRAEYDFRLTAGATWHGGEIDAGYGLSRYAGVHLSGPIIGVRAWF
jgi:hypothetical protein